jgi:hypothetical protein
MVLTDSSDNSFDMELTDSSDDSFDAGLIGDSVALRIANELASEFPFSLSSYFEADGSMLQHKAQSEVKLIIHNQSTSIELTSPVYADFHATCYLLPDQNVDAGSTTQVSFSIDPDWWWWATGVLMYKLQGKNTDQSNEDAMSSEEETTCIQLVIIWKVYSSKEFSVASYLLEHSEDYAWDVDKLLELDEYYELVNIQNGFIEDTWLMYDNTVLMTSLNMTHEECYKLDMTISETSIKDDTQRPRYIGLSGYRYIGL